MCIRDRPNTGAMKVSQEFDASDDAKVSDLFRFGMLMQLPYDMDKSQYYGCLLYTSCDGR